MDNLIFEKIWEDEYIIELKITGISEYVKIYQNCYVEEAFLKTAGEMISDYTFNYSNECHIELGSKEGNHTPAFSMKILPAESTGHMKIELDFEIADNDTRMHRACFYIEGEMGIVDALGRGLQSLAEGKISICSLSS